MNAIDIIEYETYKTSHHSTVFLNKPFLFRGDGAMRGQLRLLGSES